MIVQKNNIEVAANEVLARINEKTEAIKEIERQGAEARKKLPIEGQAFYTSPRNIHVQDNVRSKVNDNDEFRQLCESIKKFGLIQPIVCQLLDNNPKLILLAGERRLRAAEEIGLERVPVIIKNVKCVAGAQLSENLCRDGLSTLDVAEAMQETYSDGYSKKELSAMFGRDRKYVERMIRIAQWSPMAKKIIRDNENKISTRDLFKLATKRTLDTQGLVEELTRLADKKRIRGQRILDKDLLVEIRAYAEKQGWKLTRQPMRSKEDSSVLKLSIEVPENYFDA